MVWLLSQSESALIGWTEQPQLCDCVAGACSTGAVAIQNAAQLLVSRGRFAEWITVGVAAR